MLAILGVGFLLLSPVDLWFRLLEYGARLIGWEWTAPARASTGTLGLDKVVHLMLFFGLAWQVSRSRRVLGLGAVWPVFLWCASYGLMLEVLQSLTGRTGDIFDGLADALGALSFVGWAHLSGRSRIDS